jgi:hypothetical protein
MRRLSTRKEKWGWKKKGESLEARAGIEPAYTALQAAA